MDFDPRDYWDARDPRDSRDRDERDERDRDIDVTWTREQCSQRRRASRPRP
jgi:hypothetical protein